MKTAHATPDLTKSHVVLGAGATGSAIAVLLAELGAEVRVVSRSGSGPDHPGVTRVTADATNLDALAEIADGAAVIYNCVNPPYHRWTTDWPPLTKAILGAAKRTGAVLVTLSNLYMYAPPVRPMTENDALTATTVKGQVRAETYRQALEAHNAGRVRMVEARASDFIGVGLGESAHMGERVLSRVRAGKSVQVIGDPDVKHSWTAVSDVALTLVALGATPAAWGRAWHVPTVAPLTQRELIHRFCAEAGVDPVKVSAIPSMVMRMLGLFVPAMRELQEMTYQFTEPFIIDSTDAEKTLGLQPTPLPETVSAAVGSRGTRVAEPVTHQGHARRGLTLAWTRSTLARFRPRQQTN